MNRQLLLALVAAGATGCTSTTLPDAGGQTGAFVVGSVCDPGTLPDECLVSGLACTPDYTDTSPTGAFCEIPGPFYSCFPPPAGPGCAADLQCVDADVDAGIAGGCLQSCTTTADCADPLTACGHLGGLGATYCLVNNCSNFWLPCGASVDGGTDGTCVYLYDDPTEGPEGACQQAGSVPVGGACNYYRGAPGETDGGLLCTNGSNCLIDYKDGDNGVCMANCDAYADGGPACLADCVLSLPPTPPPAVSLLDFYTQQGGCAQDCTTSPTCPAGLNCQQVAAEVFACLP
jgi:hypothetical protein